MHAVNPVFEMQYESAYMSKGGIGLLLCFDSNAHKYYVKR